METIVRGVPARFHSVVAWLRQLFALAEPACVQGASDEPMPCAELERALAVGSGELPRVLHQPLLSARARNAPRL